MGVKNSTLYVRGSACLTYSIACIHIQINTAFYSGNAALYECKSTKHLIFTITNNNIMTTRPQRLSLSACLIILTLTLVLTPSVWADGGSGDTMIPKHKHLQLEVDVDQNGHVLMQRATETD